MSAFDVTINAGPPTIAVPSEEQLEAGGPSALEISIPVGQVLPFAQGPGQPPLTVQMGSIRWGMEREVALDFGQKLLDEAEKLPPSSSSKLEVASSFDGVEDAAARLEAIRRGKAPNNGS